MRSLLGSLVAKAPVPVGASKSSSLWTLPGDDSPDKAVLKAMSKQATVFAIVDGIATDMAAAKWVMYRVDRDGSRVEIDKHPALAVWQKPNPFLTQTEFVETIAQHYELAGEWWWVLGRSDITGGQGWPIEIWPVRPDRMGFIKSKTKFATGYVYTSGSDEVPLRLDQVVFNKRPNPADPYRGLGPMGSLVLDLEGEQAAAAWNRNFFRNNAEPGGLIRSNHVMSDEEFNEWLDRWRRSHKGVSNAHRVGFMEGDMEWVDRAYSQRDMQFEQLRRYSREMIRTAWRFPKPLLGDVEDVNRANADAADAVFGKRLIVPRLERLKTSLNDDFLPLFGKWGDGYEFDYLPVVAPSPEDERNTLQTASQAAAVLVAQGFDPAETLEAVGLPPITHNGAPSPGE